ncbi:MAG TPA: hypothetical protein DET40_04700 [Lentisphaeria bacterium]|nr:hypothetical protein [Lentisphaeria bacterium]
MLRQAGRLGRIFLIIFIILIAVVLYIASPVDLVPDWIPVLGQCDDIIIALLSVGFIALTLLYNLGVIGFDVTSILGSRRNSIRGLPNRQDRNK